MAIYDYWPHCPDAENQTGIYVFSYHYFSAWGLPEETFYIDQDEQNAAKSKLGWLVSGRRIDD